MKRITWFLIFTNPLNLVEDGWIHISASAFNLLKYTVLTEVHVGNMISKQICNRKSKECFHGLCIIIGNAPKFSKWSFSVSFIIRQITISGPPHNHAGLPHTRGSPPTGYMEIMLQWAGPGPQAQSRHCLTQEAHLLEPPPVSWESLTIQGGC